MFVFTFHLRPFNFQVISLFVPNNSLDLFFFLRTSLRKRKLLMFWTAKRGAKMQNLVTGNTLLTQIKLFSAKLTVLKVVKSSFMLTCLP